MGFDSEDVELAEESVDEDDPPDADKDVGDEVGCCFLHTSCKLIDVASRKESMAQQAAQRSAENL